jgi:hypothetical protein
MYYSTDPCDREKFITGRRQLADHLAAHPAVPVPTGTSRILLHADPTEDGGREQVNHIARLIGAAITDETASGGHYRAARAFGPIGFEAVSIPATVSAWHHAQNSYRGCISTGTAPTPAPLDA